MDRWQNQEEAYRFAMQHPACMLAMDMGTGKTKVANAFDKRKKLNSMNGKFNRFFFNKAMFGKNKMLYNYFKQQ